MELERLTATIDTGVSWNNVIDIFHCNLLHYFGGCAMGIYSHANKRLYTWLSCILTQSFGQQYSEKPSGLDLVQSKGLGVELPKVRSQLFYFLTLWS